MSILPLVSGIISYVSPSVDALYYKSIGIKNIGANVKPIYASPLQLKIQIQSYELNPYLVQENYINIIGEKRYVYSSLLVKGVDRITKSGGDIFKFLNKEWLVIQITEMWDTSHWSRSLVVAQDESLIDRGIVENDNNQ